MAIPFAAAELPRAAIAAGALLVAGVVAGTAPDIDLRLGLRHRGITHSLWVAAVVSLVVLVAGRLVAPNDPIWRVLALVVGLAWCSHIAADLTNRTAVAVLWPHWWGPYRFGVREGSARSLLEEWAVRLLVLALLAVEVDRYLGLGWAAFPWRA